MSRDLKPEIFGSNDMSLSRTTRSESYSTTSLATPASLGGSFGAPAKIELDNADLQVIAVQIAGLKKKNSEYEHQLEQLKQKIDEVQIVSDKKFDRIKGILSGLESLFKGSIGKLQQKYMSIYNQTRGSAMNEEKIEHLITQHNQGIQNFDLKIQRLNKIIAEQQSQLHNSNQALIETRREIEKIKRF